MEVPDKRRDRSGRNILRAVDDRLMTLKELQLGWPPTNPCLRTP
jgi:hypothetical protein